MTRWTEDAELLDDLRRAVAEADAVTERRRQAARAAYSWRTVDEELLALTFDSATSPLAGVRGSGQDSGRDSGQAGGQAGGQPRVLGFEGAGLSVELEVGEDQLMGQLVSGVTAQVRVETPDGERGSVRSDASGFFALPSRLRGPVRLVVELADGEHRTPWVVL
jgi:hypothetical protein